MPHPFPHLPRCGCLAAIGVAFSPGLLHAQSTSDAPTPVVITGNPLRSTDVAAPTNVLSGESLVLRRGATLGETLDRMPGVSSSYFGPNANRPVIRGQDHSCRTRTRRWPHQPQVPGPVKPTVRR